MSSDRTRVACIGNMNNNMFSLVRYLRDLGFDADLLLLEKEIAHFHPSYDSFDLGFQEYTVQLDWGRRQSFSRTDPGRVRESLAPYDVLIGCDTAPAFLHKAGLRLDAFVPYGGDLFILPFLTGLDRIRLWRFCRAQSAGIRESGFVDGAAYMRPAVDRLGVTAKCRYLGFPAVYGGCYHPDRIQDFYDRSAYYKEFKQVRDRFELLVFHHSRHIWKTFIDPESCKRNDLLVRGFAGFRDKRPELRAGLILFEYGPDVLATRELVAELGLESQVAWFPLMARREIMVGLSLSDVSTGEFGFPNFGGGTVYESLVLGKPLIHSRDDERSRRAGFSSLPPLVNASTSQEIAEALIRYCDDPTTFQEMGRQGREWYDRSIAETCVGYFAELIRTRGRGEALAPLIEAWPGRPAADGTDEAPPSS